MIRSMHRNLRLIVALLCIALGFSPPLLRGARAKGSQKAPQQETGFLNRKIQINGATYRFQVYLPEDWRRDDHKQWPVILFLHGRGERGSEGMWQTQIGLPQELRDHPERWPFVVVMPQCSQGHYWTDSDMLELAMTSLDREVAEFHGDVSRTYLTGLSLGGYGAWELARLHPNRWAAVAIAAGGVFWSYAPERWQRAATLPAEYAQAIGRLPVWLFHGADDNIVVPRQSDLMYSAGKTAGGNIRLWIYQGLRHDCWTRAYNEPDLPRWLLANRRDPHREPASFAERLSVPLHPPAIKLTPTQLDSIAGDYQDSHGLHVLTIFRQADQLLQKNFHGETAELAADTLTTLFYPAGSSFARITVERDAQNRVTSLILRDDRHEERWERMPTAARTHSQPE
jgi:poly(3-hydroxybutyrate) depolymerase